MTENEFDELEKNNKKLFEKFYYADLKLECAWSEGKEIYEGMHNRSREEALYKIKYYIELKNDLEM